MASAELENEIGRTIDIYEDAIGNFASRTRLMIEQHGHIEALSKLVLSPDLQKGFKILRDRGELDSTFEAVIIRFSNEFSKDAIDAAQWRLSNANELLE